MGDHDVPQEGEHLQGKRIALLITGGIAAMKAPLLARALRRQGADVVAFVSQEALRYTTIDTLEWSTVNPVITRLTSAAEHLSDSAPFDAYVVAPATYNTINKIRYGIADGVVTSSIASAIGRMEQGKTKILIVPTMHGSLHNSILTESLKFLVGMGIRIVPPREDYGKHNIPSERAIVAEVCREVSRSPLKGVPILITGGPTPVPIDNVRRITNRFRGRLGVQITEELYLRGADVLLIHGDGAYRPREHLPYVIARTFDEYYDKVMQTLQEKPYRVGVFSAAVADYRPETVAEGKLPSGGSIQAIPLKPTVKVIEKVRERYPDLYMVTFKYQERISHEELMRVAKERLEKYDVVVANRGEEVGPNGEQIAHLLTRNQEPQQAMGKKAIARLIADHLESVVGG
ncbi:MAG: bifunctional phosphopantothenoylcysteine decarboxylase/phosphopantothenate--cysteine ligase CoaBC [candidate division KSB1 bacterium]|nr:bifunctional phosphopantothenoylcysteine decarboxylase/phosphopantothenate--cysteine ligase CoaBC [candidate division KSB1 bacterium]